MRYHDFFLVPPFLFPQKNSLQPQRRWQQVRILLQYSRMDSIHLAPSGRIRYAERQMKLLSANALPAGTQEIRGHRLISPATNSIARPWACYSSPRVGTDARSVPPLSHRV